MILLKLNLYLFLLIHSISIIFAQRLQYYTAYQTSFPYVTTCPSTQYYDIALVQCSSCPENTVQKLNDITQCDCRNNSYYYGVNQGGGSLLCIPCGTGYTRSSDGFGCIIDDSNCNTTSSNVLVPSESSLNGTSYPSSPVSSPQTRYGSETCIQCTPGTVSDPDNQRCTPCASITPHTDTPPNNISCCNTGSTNQKDGICLTYVISATSISLSPAYYTRYTSPTISLFFQQHLDASVYLCRMNLSPTIIQSSSRTLLSNVTACHILANIAAMQFYYPVNNYAYNLYQTYIWEPTSPQVWSTSSIRTSIPFLAYPTTYYNEINNSSYNWIPSTFNQNLLMRLKLAKYSSTGKYLGLFDAFDAYIQLCGGAYTDGRPAFTFGTQYKRTCKIRADTLWNSALYETVFYDPYIVFTQSNSDRMLPTPIVIKNYRTDRDATPNQNDDESQWVYHRRFFLIDRISGITPTNELRNMHYAKSIKILNTLTSGSTYIQPPVIVIEYDELILSDIGKDTIVEVTFETQYRMNLNTHIRDIWIAIGVLSGLGIILALIQTIIWHSRAGKQIVDLGTIGKFLLYIIRIIGTLFFIVMAGVSLWWLIFFKRQDVVYLVIPTSVQQASFTALVVIAFALKTIDIFAVIIRQSNIDIFFIDWEKPKIGDPNAVSVWRTYFVANEYSEIQAFRRINLTFQLIFVLFFLKVINLENVATIQPNVNLFPSSADYQADYNGILRVAIAFSMWLATALIQYLVYILFYQRFVEDKIINFIDLCSISNISVFILMDNQYGFYIHGKSPHGVADINMENMMNNLSSESNQTIGTRGLQPNSKDQIFIIRVDRAFRLQYEILLRSYQSRILTRITKKGEEHESEILLSSYRKLNDFLCDFLNHSLPAYNYVIRNRVLLEKIFNVEFRVKGSTTSEGGQTESIFFIDSDKNFTKTLFSGFENSLFIWNTATFLFIDYFASNYILAAIITYILDMIAVKIRESLGRKNLAKKTLIPKNFLI